MKVKGKEARSARSISINSSYCLAVVLIVAALLLHQLKFNSTKQSASSLGIKNVGTVDVPVVVDKNDVEASTSTSKVLSEIGEALLDAMGILDSSEHHEQHNTKQLVAVRDALRGSAQNFRHPHTLPGILEQEGINVLNAYVNCSTKEECSTQLLYHLSNGLSTQLIPRHARHGNRTRIFDRMFMSSLIESNKHRVVKGSKCFEWSPIFYTQHGQVFGDVCDSSWKFDFTERLDTLRAVPDSNGGGSLQGDICTGSSVPKELENSFDFILMTDVLEHLPDPFVAMNIVYKLLKPGGLLLKTVPWFTMTHSEYHYWGANAKGLLEVLERANFTVEELRTCGSPNSVIQWMYGMNADFFDEDSDLFKCGTETPGQVKKRGWKPNFLQAQAVATKG